MARDIFFQGRVKTEAKWVAGIYDNINLESCHLLGGWISFIHPSPSLCPVRLMCMGCIDRQPCSLTSGWTPENSLRIGRSQGIYSSMSSLLGCHGLSASSTKGHGSYKAAFSIPYPLLVLVSIPSCGTSSDLEGDITSPLLVPHYFTIPPAMPKPITHLCK